MKSHKTRKEQKNERKLTPIKIKNYKKIKNDDEQQGFPTS